MDKKELLKKLKSTEACKKWQKDYDEHMTFATRATLAENKARETICELMLTKEFKEWIQQVGGLDKATIQKAMDDKFVKGILGISSKYGLEDCEYDLYTKIIAELTE